MASNPSHLPPSHTFDSGRLSPIQGSAPEFPPAPPAHRTPVGMHPENTYGQMQSRRSYHQDPNNYSDYSTPGVTPDADNLGGAAAGGGISGVALGVAGSHERESGVRALQGMGSPPRSAPHPYAHTPFSDSFAYDSPTPPRPIHSQPSYGSGSGAWSSSNSSQQSIPHANANAYAYTDSPYNRYSSSNINLTGMGMGEINPNEVADDDDWGMATPQHHQKRRSYFASQSRDESPRPTSVAAAGAAGAAGLAAGAAGVATGAGVKDGNGSYTAVPTGAAGHSELVQEKSEWLNRQKSSRKRRMWIVVAVIAFLVIGAIVGGVLGSVLNKGGGSGGSSSSKSGGNAGSVQQDNKDDLSASSDEIQKLMNNKALHKVFPGMDYTPLNTQYPDCLTVKPSQNNITRDMAVMSQLTNAVRLYGTDCNQTEMVLHAIDRLQLKDMKVWLGVWLGNNDTTNSRQVAQMWTILDKHGSSKIKGIIAGNEVLYRKDLTNTQLLKFITDIKSNLTKSSMNLPVALADLGDNWTSDMASKVDIVMSNVHPFFAGVEVEKAAAWTLDFWTTHDVQLPSLPSNTTQIIAEVGWPSGGGNDCGASTCTSTTDGSVAGIDQMNHFMQDWVCPRLANGTEYFWFEAFDEPWKIVYNTPGKEWEDKWGLFDANRNLKKGLTIPDCSGQTVPS